MSKKLWCRVGVEITLTDEEYNAFIEAYKGGAESAAFCDGMLTGFLCSSKTKLSGETYFPAKYGVGLDDCDNLDEDMDFLL